MNKFDFGEAIILVVPAVFSAGVAGCAGYYMLVIANAYLQALGL